MGHLRAEGSGGTVRVSRDPLRPARRAAAAALTHTFGFGMLFSKLGMDTNSNITSRLHPTAGYFAQRPVRPGELPAIMRKHIATGAMGSAWGTIITGIIYVYFGNAIGLSRLQWGVLGGICLWVVMMQPLGTVLAGRAGSRRLVWFWTALADRVLRMVGIIGAFLMWRAGSTSGY